MRFSVFDGASLYHVHQLKGKHPAYARLQRALSTVRAVYEVGTLLCASGDDLKVIFTVEVFDL